MKSNRRRLSRSRKCKNSGNMDNNSQKGIQAKYPKRYISLPLSPMKDKQNYFPKIYNAIESKVAWDILKQQFGDYEKVNFH